MSNLERAIKMAVELHEGQTDKAGKPYIMHPLRVMMQFTDETDMIVAVLHDVIEDTFLHPKVLGEDFGDEVMNAILSLTREEGETYADFILRAKAHPIARRVKIADINDNLRPGAEHLRERYEKALAVLEDA